ncbi:MAG TPA: MCP four helix bundle domain-containing protein, partial [Rhodocyclaceae bacterium]
MFKDLRIGVRLGLGFGLVVLLLLTVSTISLVRLSELSTNVDLLVKDKFPKTVQVNAVIDQINQIARIIRNTLLVKGDEVQKELDRIPGARKIISENLEKLSATVKSEDGKKLLDKVVDARKVYVADQDRFIEILKTGKHEDAVQFMVDQIRKSQGAYIKALDDLNEHQRLAMVKSGDETIAAASSAKMIILSIAITALLIAVIFALWITRSITRPINEAVHVASELAEGNLTVHIQVDSKDETGQLKAAMQGMISKLSQIIGEVRGSADALSSASQEVSATAQSLSQSSSEQAASVEETTASVEEM